ncbi:hypothetical protein IE077_001698 [Cardiosporidium cionae]|uniref:Solute carrier family 40 member n=1 Tax=Cardiosporidium cionae TaxID=476202 RepID=A0ABQ7JCI1_9APIC|nr:hypothetical protein IE077_001698 [Cardiosporidium cionae]|eukprot:KAF8821705.1 hypothetical protein IE077_001698 [Cardiosporidium cionae]
MQPLMPQDAEDDGQTSTSARRFWQNFSLRIFFQSEYHLLAGFAADDTAKRAWGFVSPLILYYLFPSTFFVIALYNLIANVGSVIFVPIFLKTITSFSRLSFVAITILIEACASFVNMSLILWLISQKLQPGVDLELNPWVVTAMTLVILMGTVAAITNRLRSLAIRRDWVPQLSLLEPADEQEIVLTRMNCNIVRAQLLSEIIGPIIGGYLLLLLSHSMAAFITFVILMISFMTEIGFLWYVCNVKTELLLPSDVADEVGLSGSWLVTLRRVFSVCTGCKLLLSHRVLYVIVAVGLIYFNVLAPGSGMFMAYLTYAHLDPSKIGIFRVAAAIGGFLGTTIFPVIIRWVGLHRASALALLFEVISLWVSVTSLSFLKTVESPVGYIFLVCVVLSRAGLYSYDIGAANLVQLGTEPKFVGLINAQEQSLIDLMMIVLYGASAVFAKPSQFFFLSVVSASFCSLALFSISWFCFKHRDMNEFKQLAQSLRSPESNENSPEMIFPRSEKSNSSD